MNAQFIRSIISDEVLQHFLRTKNLTDFSGETVVEAIDIGYGYTKYTTGFDAEGNVECDLFPSQAAYSPNEEMSGGFFVSRNTKKIESGGTIWEVGPDIYEIASKNEVRALHENFISSEQWKVLFLGALSYMDKEEIDLLVLGLPVSNMKKADEMRELAIGKHEADGKVYNVKDVLVVPQPLGALYNHAITSDNFQRFANTSTLVIDPGYLTFDFLVTKGFHVNPNRSGARPGGMNAVLNAIATSISKSINDTYDDVNEIDVSLDLKNYDGVKSTRPVWIYGEEVDLNDHIRNTKPVIDTSLNFMINRVGDHKDIAQIIMAGGPNKIFHRSVEGQFPKHEIMTLKEGIFANVTGFLLWGMMVAFGNKMKESQSKPKKAATA